MVGKVLLIVQVTFVLLIALLTYFPLRTEGVGLDDKLNSWMTGECCGEA